MVLRTLIFLFALLATTQVFAKEVYTLKFATLIPTGTEWTQILNNWIKDVEAKSNGRLKFKMYPGGVMGDEPDVLRKIRKGQLHGGLFTGYGIGRVYSPARVLEVPCLFKDTDESDYVRDQIMPDIEKGFKENGFELLGWPEIGFIHFFSNLVRPMPTTSIMKYGMALESNQTRNKVVRMGRGDPDGVGCH